MDSMLTTIKKILGIEPEYTHFDSDIILNINSALMVLTQIGVGPPNGFFITDAGQLWTDFLGDRKDIEAVKMYIGLKTKLSFDPPTSSFVLESIERQLREIEWRLNVQVDKPTIVEGGIIDE